MLKYIGFENVGRIVEDDGKVRILLESNSGEKGFVYAWVEYNENGNPENVVYIGSTPRCLQGNWVDEKADPTYWGRMADTAPFWAHHTVAAFSTI